MRMLHKMAAAPLPPLYSHGDACSARKLSMFSGDYPKTLRQHNLCLQHYHLRLHLTRLSRIVVSAGHSDTSPNGRDTNVSEATHIMNALRLSPTRAGICGLRITLGAIFSVVADERLGNTFTEVALHVIFDVSIFTSEYRANWATRLVLKTHAWSQAPNMSKAPPHGTNCRLRILSSSCEKKKR